MAELTRCEQCRHYAKLAELFHYKKDGYPEGVTVHGFCGKDAVARFAFYPVYLPDGGVCKSLKKISGVKVPKVVEPEQMEMEGI